jgi:hypothetical protein
MAGTPPQQQAVCKCDECKSTKKTATREVSFNSTTRDSVTKHHQGSVDWDGFAGGADRQNTETASNGSTITRTENFFICTTEGCVRRKIDRWKVREWELRNDPNLNNSEEYREQEKQRINDEENSLRRDEGEFLNQNRATKREVRRGEEMGSRQQDEKGYHSARSERETENTRQSARNSTRQSSRQSRDNGSRSQQSDEQTTANGWGTTDADRASNQTHSNRDAFRGDVDARTNTTQTGNDVFADNVYDEETAADDETATKRDTFQDATDPESLDDDTTETHNRSWSQSRDR